MEAAAETLEDIAREKLGEALHLYQKGDQTRLQEPALHAICVLDELLRRDPGKVSALVDIGTAQGLLGNHEAAISTFTDVLGFDPDHVSARYLRGRAYVKLGRFEEASHDMREVYSSGVQEANVLFWLGYSLIKIGENKKAITCLRAAVGKNELDPDYRLTLIQALVRDDALEDARREAQELIELFPTNYKGYFALGKTSFELGDLQQAIASCETAIRYERNDEPELFQIKAVSHYRLDQIGESLATLDQGISEFPRVGELYSSRAQVLIEVGLLNDAILDLHKALRRGGNVSRVYASLGEVYLRIVDRALAREEGDAIPQKSLEERALKAYMRAHDTFDHNEAQARKDPSLVTLGARIETGLDRLLPNYSGDGYIQLLSEIATPEPGSPPPPAA